MLITIPIGARLLHIFYEAPSYYAEAPFRVFEVWKGGFVYFGGLIFSILFFAFYFKKYRERTFWQTADFFTPILSLGTGFGRLACFFQGCCFGKNLDAFWSFRGLHPTQLYLFFWEAGLFLILLRLEKLKLKSGNLFLIWIVTSAFGRFIVEFYRNDFRGQMISGFSISQVVSFILMACGLCLFVALNKLNIAFKDSNKKS